MKKYTFRHDSVDGYCLGSITLPAFFMAALLAGSFLGCAEKQDCFKDADCAWGKFCRSGFCISECRFDVDCEFPGMVCVQHRGYCRYPDAGVNDDSGVMDGATAPDAAVDSAVWYLDSEVQEDGATTNPDAGPITDGIYTDPCTSGQQCGSGFCLSDLRSNVDFCSGTCANDNSCIMTHECENFSGQSMCQVSDLGIACTSGDAVCSNNCIGNEVTGIGHCTSTCTSASDCPAGFACTTLGTLKYCVDISMTCTGDMDCLTGVCLAPYGYNACTATCVSSADCPLDYICESDGYNWYCVPPTYGTGGLGDMCDGSTFTCQSGLCLGDYCTSKCGIRHNVGQWCPPDFGCAIAGGDGGNFLVCAAAGNKGFGQSCSIAEECASTLCREMSDSSMECTRFCNDGVTCPTGYTCQSIGVTASGISLAVCDR